MAIQTQKPFAGTMETGAAQSVVADIVEGLDNDPDALELYEGDVTGHLYVEIQDEIGGKSEFYSLEITNEGLLSVTVDEPDEELSQVVVIKASEGDEIEEAVGLAFAGD